MKKIILVITPLLFFACKSQGQNIGTIQTEEYQASFEQRQSIDAVADYDDTIVLPIQILKIGINDEVYEMYPELRDKRVGLGVTNIVLEYLEYTDRFIFTEDKEEIKQRMIKQQKASDAGISANEIQVKGNVILAEYFVYIEVYDFSVSEDEVISTSEGTKITQTTRLGLQVRFVDAQTGEIYTGSGMGEASTVKTTNLFGDDLDEIKFNQSTIGISTKKALETASSRIVTKLIKKGKFNR